MATLTLGSKTTTSLTAIKFLHGMNATDFATIVNSILNDGQGTGGGVYVAPSAKPKWPGPFTTQGQLFIPNRGVLQVLPGDYVAVDANGWPILLSANAIAGGASPSATTSWQHS